MGYDPARQVVVLFGGRSGSSTDLSETWEYSAGVWSQMSFVGPGIRSFAGMVYDPIRAELLMFGGLSGATDLNETWVYSGSGWTRRQPTSSPPVRHAAGLVWDPTRQRVLAFGGAAGNPEVYLSDTWAWDGANWVPLSVGAVGPIWIHQAAHDSARNVTVFYGGFSGSSQTGGWELGTSWTQRSWTSQPSARHGASVVYDSSLQRVLLFGGYSSSGSTYRGDFFLYDGSTWQTATPAPSARGWASMVFDSNRNRVILFGGDGTNGALNDTWEY